MQSIKLFFIFFIVFSFTLHFKINAAEFSRYLNNYSVEDGLSQSVVNQIIQDKYGYIWVATDYGLNRFDGYDFEQISGLNNSFSSDGIIHMSELNDGSLLVSTYYNGAYLLDPQTLATQNVFSGKLPNVSKLTMSIEHSLQVNNSLWFAIGPHLVHYDLKLNIMDIRYSLPTETGFIRALAYHNDTFYLATTDGLILFNQDSGQAKLVAHLPGNIAPNDNNSNIKSFFWDKDYGLLIGTVNGLYLFDIEQQISTKTLITDLNIWGLVKLDKIYYIATQRGLYSLELATKKIISIAKFSDINPLITNDSIKSIFQDNSGLIWLASQLQGVFTFNPTVKNFSSYSRLSSLKLSHSVVYDFFEEKSGVFWIATENGLNKLDSTLNTTKALFMTNDASAVFGKHTIYSIFPQKNGKFWLWHGHGLSLFDPVTELIIPSTLTTTTNDALAATNPFGMVQIGPNKFFFIGNNGHFALDIVSNKIEPLSALDLAFKPEYSATFLKSFTKGTHILLATTGGLIDYDYEKNTFKTIYQIKNFNFIDYKYVSQWHRSTDGHIWLAINGFGVVELDPQYRVLREINKENGLTDLRVYGINESKSGDIWISSQAGLTKYNRTEDKLSHYSTKQGLISNEIYETSAILSNGEMAFSSAAGLVFFNPEQVSRDMALSPQVKILSVAVASRDIVYPFYQLTNKHFVLNHDDYGINFKFSNFNFPAQNKVKYQVELKGKNNIIYEGSYKNSIEFNKLVPGNYEFTVRAIAPFNGDIGAAATFNFSVNHNPYFSPIAYIIYILIIISFFVYFYRRRIHQQLIVQKAHEQVLSAKQRADLALEASNSGIWSFNRDTGHTHQNRLRELGHDVSDNGVISDYLKYIHPDDRQELKHIWYQFLNEKIKHWDVCYRVKDSHGDWIWFRDLGNASSITDKSSHLIFIGTYTNINATKANEMQAQLYGQALKKMNEWLVILDRELQPITSNSAFNKRFLKKGEQLTAQSLNLIFRQEKLNQYTEKVKSLALHEKLISEDIIAVPAGFDIPVLISISAIGDTTIDNYVVVISDLSAQKEVENKLKHLANFDSLTHLANRTLIRDRIEQAIVHAKEKAIGLLFIDLDRFKQVNDIYGHAMGDQVLVEVANRMNEVVGEQHSVGRQSGDEFIILLEDISTPEQASHYADLLTKALAQPYQLANQTVHISSSIGIALYPFDSVNGEELIQNADIAMLHAKQRGRNGYRFFTEEMNIQIKNRVLMEDDFINTVQNNGLINYYQPIVDIANQKITGVELLLRWRNRDQMISPNVFIPLAENIGQIAKLTELALEKALNELSHWLIDSRYLSINLSAIHISQPQMVDSLLAILHQADVSPHAIRLEITEGVLIDDTDNAKQQLNRLKNAGFQIFLDDFGTGYSSLTYINQFPIDVIKIDQCFVRELASDKTSKAIVQTIANLAHNIDSYCVVEGVEELSQVAILKQLGCYHMQGYFFARPMPILDLLCDRTMQSINHKISKANKA
ncbi:MAG: EAL domain-containing protein [Gammaproteobacteria bacterium]|nr:EAL domain-containing protein [Gammaproteobacteria bacterium]